MSDSLRLHELQHTRLPCPSLSPWVCSRSCPLNQPSNHLVICHILLLLPSIFPSITVFSHKSALQIREPKYWSFSISPSNEYSGSISFRIDWFDLLAVSRVFSSTRVQKHQFLGTQPSSLSRSHIRTWLLEKPSLTIWTFVTKMITLFFCLFFNMLSSFVIAFLPRSKYLLILWP